MDFTGVAAFRGLCELIQGREGEEGWGRAGGREGGVGGREGTEGGREGGRGPSEAKLGFPPALPHCLLYFLKLYNVFNDNVQSIR